MSDTTSNEQNVEAGGSFSEMYAHMKQLAASFLANSATSSDKTPSSLLHEAWVRVAETPKSPQQSVVTDERLSLANALYNVLRDHAQQMRAAGELKSGFIQLSLSDVDEPTQQYDGPAFAID